MKARIHILAVGLILLAPLTTLACGLSEKTAAGFENTDVHHAHQHWQQGNASPIPFMLLDVRTPEEFTEGHIAGAKLIPVQELASRMTDVPRNKQVYVYCRSGTRSAKASEMLAEAGFTNIENVQGGIEAWKAAGYPVSP